MDAINQVLQNQSTATISFNDDRTRKFASTGQAGAQRTQATAISYSQFLNRSYKKVSFPSDSGVVGGFQISGNSYWTANAGYGKYTYTGYTSGATYGVATIASTVLGSTNSSTPALTIQGVVGDLIEFQNAGTIVGAGGTGGSSGQAGFVGGPALKVQGATTILYNVGTIAGGGGGGGAAVGYEDCQTPRAYNGGGGGGGGGGYVAGTGGTGQSNTYNGAVGRPGQAGQASSPFGGGTGGTGGRTGGAGGSIGQAGGTGGAGYGPGASGKAICGIAYVQIAQQGTMAGGNA
jgi:hypothetical protein